MENSLCEKPERHASRRLSDHLVLEGRKQKVHSLVDKVYSRKNLKLAWERVRANQGASGPDKVTIAEFETRLDEKSGTAPSRAPREHLSAASRAPIGDSEKGSPRQDKAARHTDAPGIMHLIQFALGMPGGDDLSSRPNLAAVDRRGRRF